MGEVYKARDTRLQRDVAIKVLPAAVFADPERRARFEREARTLASLNHPHIAQIYGVEEFGGAPALVMELVEGPTLAERIARGPIAPDEALPIASQIAGALEGAHERGIVHRDLKPANIKLRDEGTVKVLDFGLAKAVGPSGADRLTSPTVTSPAFTERGLILGTAAYMAPEQARGKTVDKRADIWAFGVVFFEMLTGRQLFEGETVSDTLAAVLRQDIPWGQLPPNVPPSIVRLLRLCLVREPKDRLHDIADARLDIEAAMHASESAPATIALSVRQHRWRSRAGWIVAGVAIVTSAALWLTRTPANERLWQQFTRITDAEGEETAPSLSPDGEYVAYSSRARGNWDIYVQRVGGHNRTLVAGDPARQESAPAFSPDGKTIAYHDGTDSGGIFLVGATGESSRRLTDFGFHPSWSPDGKRIAFSTEQIGNPYATKNTGGLWVVEVSGGATARTLEVGELQQPTWSPSGTRIAFWTSQGGRWLPDGRLVYFTGDMSELVVLDPDAGRRLVVPVKLPLPASPDAFAVARDGRTIYYGGVKAEADIWTVERGPS